MAQQAKALDLAFALDLDFDLNSPDRYPNGPRHLRSVFLAWSNPLFKEGTTAEERCEIEHGSWLQI
ncbi:hypothetical protein CTM76_20465 [Photobacterium phosphoreum]|nr:hypothetical protein AYY25_19610 [Photobacterium phosphoreum]PSU74972.1 hypothetical protein CTM76_20465 [Photobacterium phosphoreum]